MVKLTIRQIEESDLDKVDNVFKSEFGRPHADDLHDQSLSNLSFFVAWMNGNPVGHALARWLGPREETVSSNYPNCPEIYRLRVLKEFRSQGIATEIIRKCENEALKRHCLLIGLGTHSNLASRDNLYIRSGYEPSTIDNYIDTYKTKLENGTVVTIRKEAQFLIKRIGD